MALLKYYDVAEENHKIELLALQHQQSERQGTGRQEAPSKSGNQDEAPDHHVENVEQPEDDNSGPSPGQMTLF